LIYGEHKSQTGVSQNKSFTYCCQNDGQSFRFLGCRHGRVCCGHSGLRRIGGCGNGSLYHVWPSWSSGCSHHRCGDGCNGHADGLGAGKFILESLARSGCWIPYRRSAGDVVRSGAVLCGAVGQRTVADHRCQRCCMCPHIHWSSHWLRLEGQAGQSRHKGRSPSSIELKRDSSAT
jgi:hypothetical protein